MGHTDFNAIYFEKAAALVIRNKFIGIYTIYGIFRIIECMGKYMIGWHIQTF